ncbi:MAG TPA: flagellar motor protein MotB [Casimicrobiaceae bacterium]|jgi:chemotaxis protein MotB
MSGEQKPPIIVRRIKKGGHGHHGGAWKIAYADFVTAMMAFFLLMWLLGSTTKGDLEGIAQYFRTPLKVALQGGSGSGDSSSVIQGGGRDLTRTNGQVAKAEKPIENKTLNLQAAQAAIEQQEMDRLRDLKRRIEIAIENSPTMRAFRNQIKVDLTPEGLRIQIVDEQNRPMFDIGSAVLKDYTREILRELAVVLNSVSNRISLSGHTDAKPYAGGDRGYSNWELSVERANASRRELVAGGIEEKKIVRVVGLGSAVLLDRTDPFNPQNRRISITVLNQRAEKRILEDGTDGASPAGAEPASPPPSAGAPASEGEPRAREAATPAPMPATPPPTDATQGAKP